MYQFLQRCLELLRKEFSELKTVTADQLMYVKEDLILPHHYTFYDFIVTKVKALFRSKIKNISIVMWAYMSLRNVINTRINFQIMG